MDALLRFLGLDSIAHLLVGTAPFPWVPSVRDADLDYDVHATSWNLTPLELRKLNLAVELAAAPLTLLIEEPFAGLGERATTEFAGILRCLAHLDMTVVMTCGPSCGPAVFGGADDLLLLTPTGGTAYMGTAPKARTYFECLGYTFEEPGQQGLGVSSVLGSILAGRAEGSPIPHAAHSLEETWAQERWQQSQGAVAPPSPGRGSTSTGREGPVTSSLTHPISLSGETTLYPSQRLPAITRVPVEMISSAAIPSVPRVEEAGEDDDPTLSLPAVLRAPEYEMRSPSLPPLHPQVPVSPVPESSIPSLFMPSMQARPLLPSQSSDPLPGTPPAEREFVRVAEELARGRGATFFWQTILCHNRHVSQQLVDYRAFIAEWGLAVFVAIVISGFSGYGEVFHGMYVAPYTGMSPAPVEYVVPFLFVFLQLGVAFAVSPFATDIFGTEREVFWRETTAGHLSGAFFVVSADRGTPCTTCVIFWHAGALPGLMSLSVESPPSGPRRPLLHLPHLPHVHALCWHLHHGDPVHTLLWLPKRHNHRPLFRDVRLLSRCLGAVRASDGGARGPCAGQYHVHLHVRLHPYLCPDAAVGRGLDREADIPPLAGPSVL